MMRIYIKLLMIFLVLGLSEAMGQTISLPDTNLINKLQEDYPQVMEGEELDTSEAQALTGVLNLSNANISDANGIEYFTSINTLDITNNNLRTIPDINAISGLLRFYASDNQLDTLPDMDSLTQLRDFQVMYNELSALPALSGNSLLNIYCTDNNISSIPSLTQFPNLARLVMGENPIEWPVDFSSNTSLLELHIHQTEAERITGLDSLTNLEYLYAWDNNISDFSGLDSITTLAKCVIYNNPVSELPYLANKPDLNELLIHNCRFTFKDIRPLMDIAPDNFEYEPQRNIWIGDKEVRARNDFTVEQPITNPLRNNIYVWERNGEAIDSSTSQELTFEPLQFSDSGDYVLKVYNPDVPDLVLQSYTFHISVRPCLELALPNVNILDKECSKGYTIDISDAQISGGMEPFRYTLDNGFFQETFEEKEIKNIPAGNYQLTITDAKGCTGNADFNLNRIKNCDAVLTPNGDGVADTYFIEGSGEVKIYNMNRQLVQTLQAPVNWDGTGKNGSLLDAGYYIILKEGQSPTYISIMR